MKTVNIGLIGFGTVGKGVFHLLRDNSTIIAERTGLELKIVRICDLDQSRIQAECPHIPGTTSWQDIVDDPSVDVVIELIGGIEPARSILIAAMEAGKDVVTANKKLLAEKGADIFNLADSKGLSLGFEAAVGGGIPCVLALKSGLVANRVRSIMGILNGTTNYILTRMSDENMAFDDALKIAQEKGFAEADPTFDIEGFDAGHKIAILTMLAFNKNVEFNSIPIEGISGIQPLDIAYARDNGYAIKLLAMAKKMDGRIDISVRPTMISETHPLARVREEYNAVLYDCNMTDPVILSGRGAGGLPTASAVISDVVRIVESKGVLRTPVAARKNCEFLPARDRISSYYLRMCTLDSPGILSRISGVFARYDISIASVLQRGNGYGDSVPLILMTHSAPEEAVINARKELESFDFISGDVMVIRVEDLDL